MVHRKTQRGRLIRKLKERRMHTRLREQHGWLARVLPRALPTWAQDSLRGLRRGASSVELSSTGNHELLLSHSDFIH
jgi:hypothetical protein